MIDDRSPTRRLVSWSPSDLGSCDAVLMTASSGKGRTEFPRLFAEAYVPYAGARARCVVQVPPDRLVSRLHVVALTAQEFVVVCQSVQGWRFLPGGTREPDESLDDLARRELVEEAGATLEGRISCFAAHEVDSERAGPYRPHLPHPRAYWAYATARVTLTGSPTNPADGEQVVEVLTLPPDAAADYLEVADPVHADVVRHAVAMGLLGD